jgi:tetratricopeptide (TPR) repeat protein/DNA-binding CsgD family transcriptional regulator
MMRMIHILILVFAISMTYAQSVTDSLIHSFHSNMNDSLRVNAAILLYDHMVEKHPDSLYLIIEDAIKLAKQNDYDEKGLRLFILKGQVFDRLNDFVKAQQVYLHAEKVLDSIRETIADSSYIKHKISITNAIATIFFRTNKLDDARKYYEQVIDILQHARESELPFRTGTYYMITYNNIGSVYLQKGEYDPAETFYLKAMSYLAENDKKGMSTILNNLGIIEKDRGNYQQALDYLNRSLSLRREEGYLAGEVQALNNIGDLLWKTGQTGRALDTLLKVSRMAKENQLLPSYNIALEKLSAIHYELGDYKEAYEAHLEYKSHYDSLMNQENLNYITQLEMQQRFEQKINEENLLRQKEDLARQRREGMYLATIIIASLVLTILILLYALQRGKLKRHQLKAEKNELKRKSLELENDKLNLQLELKNKELTTNVIYLARTNEFISEVAEKLLKRRIYFTKENQKLIDELIRDLQNFSERDTWKEFELRFQEVHSEFYKKLIDKFPDLSSNEKKLCAFLRLNMTTKEISAITYQSINSITVARSRLRKKLGIDKDENLVAFLEKL